MKSIAIIFDLNGTLIDSEVAHSNAYAEALAEHGIKFTIAEFTNYWTRQGKKIHDYLAEIGRHDLLHLGEQILEDKQKIFHNTFVEKSILMPGGGKAIERLKKDFKLGLETSGSGDNAFKLLKHFNIWDFFDAIVTRDTPFDEAKYGKHKEKNARLKYLTELLSVEAQNCVMIGDAEKDINGAKKVGMKTIAVPNEYTKDNDFSLADKILGSLNELNPELIFGLFK